MTAQLALGIGPVALPVNRVIWDDEADWYVTVRCLDCPALWVSDEPDDWTDVRDRGALHAAITGHRISASHDDPWLEDAYNRSGVWP